jgi:hypothetical protein
MIARRNFLFGLGAVLAAPAIIRPGLLMRVRSILLPAPEEEFYSLNFIYSQALSISDRA